LFSASRQTGIFWGDAKKERTIPKLFLLLLFLPKQKKSNHHEVAAKLKKLHFNFHKTQESSYFFAIAEKSNKKTAFQLS
jgi:hypothetical protein